MESLKDYLTPTTFSFYGYFEAIGRFIGGTIFSASIAVLRASERQNFYCHVGSKSPFDKNFLRASCFDQYNENYNLPLPLYGFVVLSFLILTLISIVYSWCCVKSRVEEVEKACKIDVENPRPRPTFTTRRVFNCYLTQLLVRLILGILFTVLQNCVLYPSGFPTSFLCEMKLEKFTVPDTNLNSSFIDCRNSIGSDKNVLAMLVWIVNMILACLVAGEIIYLIIKVCGNKDFMNDSEFCQRYLFSYRRETASTIVVEQYRMSLYRNIIEDTQVLGPLIPPSAGENEGCKNLDDIYVNRIMHTGRSRPDLNTENMDMLRIQEELLKPPENSIRIKELKDLVLSSDDSHDPRKILIVGCPGIGKTLLCKKLLREVLQKLEPRKFVHLSLINFRNFNSEEMKNMSLQTLLSHGKYSEGKLDEEMFQHLLEHPEEILLVFDGLDELKDHKKCIKEGKKHAGNLVADVMPFAALYVKLIEGRFLKGATVLTTSRPYAIDSVDGLKYDRLVEILGFSPKEVKEYFTKNFCDHSIVIWQHVQNNLNLLNLCYIPLNCSIVGSVLEETIKSRNSSLRDVSLPTTLTEIYEEALRLFIFKTHPEYKDEPLTKSELGCAFSSEVEDTLLKLETLAVKGIDERRLVFESEEVQGMENCGLLNRLPDLEHAPFTYKPQYCFIHLTLQEFVAARGIAKMDPQNLQEFVSSKAKDVKWHLVIQFVAGLLRDKESVVNNIFAKNLRDALLPSSGDSRGMAILMMKCLYETNDISSVKRAAAELKSNSEFTNQIDLSRLSLTPVDCTAIVYFLQHIKNLEYLDGSGNPLGDGGCSEISKLIEAGGPLNLNLCKCEISNQGLITVLEAMKTAETCNLSQLNVSFNQGITGKGYSYLCDALMDEKCTLTELVIDDMLVNEDISLKLSNALKHRNCKLTKLHFPVVGSIKKYFNVKKVYLNFCSALVDENCKLRDLMLYCDSACIAHICAVLKNENCKLTKLKFVQNTITDEEISCVCEALKHLNCKFTKLCLSPMLNRNDFLLLDAPENTKTICITYHDFQITDLGISYLCDVLKHKDSKLTRLSLAGLFSDDLTKRIDDLKNAITHDNCKLEELTLRFGKNVLRPKVSNTINYICKISNSDGQKVIKARKGDSGQYEKIALSSMVFEENTYEIKIER